MTGKGLLGKAVNNACVSFRGKGKGRARYRPIDDRVRYWANLFLDEVRDVEVRKFLE